MLDQDTARALLTIADETGARVAFVGDRHQLPAVGRGGVLDHAVAWAHPTAVRHPGDGAPVHRPRLRRAEPADAHRRRPRRGVRRPAPPRPGRHPRHRGRTHRRPRRRRRHRRPGHRRHPRTGRRPQRRHPRPPPAATQRRPMATVTTAAGERIGLGDRVATRRNDPDLQVANRQTWTVTGIGDDGSLILHGHGRDREVPAEYAARFVELAYATTVHGAQGETVDPAHVAHRRAHRRRGGVRRHDPRPRQPTPPTSSPSTSRTPASNGSRSSAATAPTSDPPTHDARPSTPSTATARPPHTAQGTVPRRRSTDHRSPNPQASGSDKQVRRRKLGNAVDLRKHNVPPQRSPSLLPDSGNTRSPR